MDGVDVAAVFDALPIPTAVLGPDGVFQLVNRAYEEVCGRSRTLLIGAKIYERFPGGPADQGARVLRASLERVVAEGRIDVMPLLRYDVESPRGVVEERYWSLMNAPVFGPDGTVTHIIHRGEEATAFVDQVRGVAATPTSRSSPFGLEARMQVIEADLYARTAELQADNLRLHSARERDTIELRLEMERHRNAVADTSHDLRGPITGLQLRLQAALEDPQADPHDILRAALLDAERLGDIVADLLELARLNAGAPATSEPVDLTETVRASLERRTRPEPKIDARLAEGVVVTGSPVRLMRVVDNLLSNAERHARSRIEVLVTTEDGHAVLEVCDDGPGIPEEDREAVFDRFFRRADARRADPSGTGLGLAICREIAHNHGGTLRVADCDGGARLVLRIPLTPTTPLDPEHPL
ncbi:ATP-binding protein [Spirillospora sp. NPDC047279]|uniref:sensor histidine kinase n=1 Tax=Spirillospora sp. NPDC047279 TaxID=3155478 RepID=UPI00340EC26B